MADLTASILLDARVTGGDQVRQLAADVRSLTKAEVELHRAQTERMTAIRRVDLAAEIKRESQARKDATAAVTAQYRAETARITGVMRAENQLATAQQRLANQVANAHERAARSVSRTWTSALRTVEQTAGRITAVLRSTQYVTGGALLAGGAFAVGIGKQVLEAQSQLESFEKFISALGGRGAFQQVRDFALKSPLSVQETFLGAQKLLNYGHELNDILRERTGLLEAETKASVAGKKDLDQVVDALERIRSGNWRTNILSPIGVTPQFIKELGFGWDNKKNRPMGLDANSGPQFYDKVIEGMIAKYKDVKLEDLLKTKVTNIKDAFDFLFYGIGKAFDDFTKPFLGKFQEFIMGLVKFTDSPEFKGAANAINAQLLGPMAERVIAFFNDINKYLREHPEALTQAVIAFANGMKLLGEVFIAASIASVFTTIIQGLAAMAALLTAGPMGWIALTAAITGATAAFVVTKSALDGVTGSLQENQNSLSTTMTLLGQLGSQFSQIGDSIAEAIGGKGVSAIGLLNQALQFTVDLLKKFGVEPAAPTQNVTVAGIDPKTGSLTYRNVTVGGGAPAPAVGPSGKLPVTGNASGIPQDWKPGMALPDGRDLFDGAAPPSGGSEPRLPPLSPRVSPEQEVDEAMKSTVADPYTQRRAELKRFITSNIKLPGNGYFPESFFDALMKLGATPDTVLDYLAKTKFGKFLLSINDNVANSLTPENYEKFRKGSIIAGGIVAGPVGAAIEAIASNTASGRGPLGTDIERFVPDFGGLSSGGPAAPGTTILDALTGAIGDTRDNAMSALSVPYPSVTPQQAWANMQLAFRQIVNEATRAGLNLKELAASSEDWAFAIREAARRTTGELAFSRASGIANRIAKGLQSPEADPREKFELTQSQLQLEAARASGRGDQKWEAFLNAKIRANEIDQAVATGAPLSKLNDMAAQMLRFGDSFNKTAPELAALIKDYVERFMQYMLAVAQTASLPKGQGVGLFGHPIGDIPFQPFGEGIDTTAGGAGGHWEEYEDPNCQGGGCPKLKRWVGADGAYHGSFNQSNSRKEGTGGDKGKGQTDKGLQDIGTVMTDIAALISAKGNDLVGAIAKTAQDLLSMVGAGQFGPIISGGLAIFNALKAKKHHVTVDSVDSTVVTKPENLSISLAANPSSRLFAGMGVGLGAGFNVHVSYAPGADRFVNASINRSLGIQQQLDGRF